MMYEFTYEELKPLIDFLNKNAYPSERHYPGANAIINKLIRIGAENDSTCDESQKRINRVDDKNVQGKPE